MDHANHHLVEPEQHIRYTHNDHIGYQHNQDSSPPAFRSHPSSVPTSSAEANRPMTPPSHGHTNMHMPPMTTASDTRQRSVPMSTSGPSPSISVPGSSYSTVPLDAPRKISTTSGQPSLPPPRSLSLKNILNVPETESNIDTTETEEDAIASSVNMNRASQDHDYPEHSQSYAHQQDPEHRAGTETARPEPISADHFGQAIAPDVSFVDSQHESQLAGQYDGKDLKADEKVVLPVIKDKSPKEKIVKVPKTTTTKKGIPIKMPPKKKAFASSAVLPVSESNVSAIENGTEHSAEPVPHATQDPVVGQKHNIEELEKNREESAIKKVRVDDHSIPENERSNTTLVSPPANSQSYVESTATNRYSPIQRLNPTRTDLPGIGDEHSVPNVESVSVLPEQLSTRAQESPRQKFEPTLADGHGIVFKHSNAAGETANRPAGPTGTSSVTPSAPSPIPTPSSTTGKLKTIPEGDFGNHSKKSSNEGPHDHPSPSSLVREPLKSAKITTPAAVTPPLPLPIKEKKVNKKKSALEASQQLDGAVVTNKVAKSNAPQKETDDMDVDSADTKASVKSTSGSKKSTSASSPHSNSLKKRFSKSVESISSLIEDPRQNEATKTISGHTEVIQERTTVDSPRDKSIKPKRVDRPEPVPISGSKSESSRSQQSSSRLNEGLSSQSRLGTGQSQADEDGKLYCICKTLYDKSRFMIACDGCDDWFHGDCVGVAEKDSDMVDKYYCKRCEDKGRHASGKKVCIRGSCQKPAVRKSKYCSRECGLLVATQRIHESQARAFGIPIHTGDNSTTEQHPQDQAQQQLQRRRRLTLADLDDRQRLLGIREKMSHVRKVCCILDAREKQLSVCIDRQARQDLGKFDPLSSVSSTVDKEEDKAALPEEEEEEDIAPRHTGSSSSKSKSKGKSQKGKDKDKDKDGFCGFDYSLVWDDAQDMSRIDRIALTSLGTTPTGSRASSVAPPSFGVVLVNQKRQSSLAEELGNQGKNRNGAALSPDELSVAANTLDSSTSLSLSPQLEEVGVRVCMTRRQCDRHIGWQKLKAAELDLEKTLQNKLLKTLKSEAKLVKNRMKRRRNDLSAGLLNGTIEHRPIN
ncbi:hypothetical protein BGX21_008338 [Mortierella sp. AD011]|nr:hypothetical protein BGX21_008338 [Mortierella sp. AD011]